MLRSVICFLFIFVIVYCDTNCPACYSNRDTTHCFKVYTTQKTKADAAAQCASDGGYLSLLSNGFDNSYVYSLGQNAPAPLMWLGIECYNTSKSSCVNDDGSTFGPYDNFYPGNPSVLGNCVYMSNKSPTSAAWFSFDCDNAPPFLCEFDYGSQCQPGYTKSLGSCYKVITSLVAEVDAELDCQADCGHLASFHSDQENNFLTSFVAASINGSTLVRIGLKQVNSLSKDVWMDNTTLNYTNYGYIDSNIGLCYGLSLADGLVAKEKWISESCDSVILNVCKTAAGICQPATPTQSPPQCSSPTYLTNPRGTGTGYSPGYPGPFDYSPQCFYFISTTAGFAVELVFATLQLAPTATISLYNDISDDKPFAVIDISTENNATYKSHSNEMVLVFSYPFHGNGGIWEFTYGPAEIRPSHSCAAGYSLNNGLCYKFISQPMTGEQTVSSNCKADGGILAVIPTYAINQFLLTLMNPSDANWAYIGLTCSNVTTTGDISSCVWQDGTKITYNGFGSGNPSVRSDAHCVFLEGGRGDWVNDPCTITHYSFCQTNPVAV